MSSSQYYVVMDRNLNKLIERVNELLAKGWKLQGGVCVWNGLYFQAVVI